jgi:hypothetical protein
MRKITFTALGALALVLLVLAACAPATPAGGTTAGSQTTGKGQFTVHVQPVSPAVMDLYNRMHKGKQAAKTAAPPKAYLGAVRVDFSVRSPDQATSYDDWSEFPTQTGGSPGTGLTNAGPRTLNAGSYVLVAWIYGYDENGTFVAVSAGTKPFVVTTDQAGADNVVTVTCLPLSYSNISDTDGAAAGPYQLSALWSLDLSQRGSEKWFLVYTAGSLTDFTASADSGSEARPALFLFDSAGHSITSAMAPSEGGQAAISGQETASGSYYWVGVVDFSNSGNPRNILVRAKPYQAPPTPVTVFGTYFPDTLQPNQAIWYSFSGLAGHTYAINWDDVIGSGSENADIIVSAYQGDQSTPWFSYTDTGYKGDFYYAYGNRIDNPIDGTKTFTLSTDDTVFVRVGEYFAGSTSGNFQLMVTDQGITYSIGGTGPAGGLVFYDKGSYSDGWRYLEAAPSDQSDGIQWYNGSYTTTGASGTAIGTGAANTTAIVAALGAGSYAAELCADLSLGGYDDWFLPSMDELNLMYVNLAQQSLGGFAGSVWYWSSSEHTVNDYAWGQFFNGGDQNGLNENDYEYVRAVRAF